MRFQEHVPEAMEQDLVICHEAKFSRKLFLLNSSVFSSGTAGLPEGWTTKLTLSSALVDQLLRGGGDYVNGRQDL